MNDESHQPTHHGYAVNVKHEWPGHIDLGELSEYDAQCVWDGCAELFWMRIQDTAKEHGFRGAYSEGRSGGWCQPYPQPCDNDMYQPEIEAWERNVFRPFERDVLAEVESITEDYNAELADAIRIANAEPAEAAYWAARDVPTIRRTRHQLTRDTNA